MFCCAKRNMGDLERFLKNYDPEICAFVSIFFRYRKGTIRDRYSQYRYC